MWLLLKVADTESLRDSESVADELGETSELREIVSVSDEFRDVRGEKDSL